MSTPTIDREDIYDATRDLVCRMSYLLEHLALKALRGKSIQSHLDVLMHSREALEVAPMFLELPDLLIDQIDQLCAQSDELQRFIEADNGESLTPAAISLLQQMLMNLPHGICELPLEYRSMAARVVAQSGQSASAP